MAHQTIPSIVEEILQPFLEPSGFELVDVEYVKEGKNWFLRVFVDKAGGIDIDDCGKISEYLGKKLDESDPIPEAYFLEVCSPGAERPLKKTEDYHRAVNKDVFVTTNTPIGDRTEFEGKLLSFDGQQLEIKAGKSKVTVPLDKVANARLTIIF